MLVYILIGIGAFALYASTTQKPHNTLEYRKREMEGAFEKSEEDETSLSVKRYEKDEHVWNPTFHLLHKETKLFNLPFEPDDKEIFYIENEYEEDANRYRKENIDYVTEKLSEIGLRFVYLPYVKVPKEMILTSIAYRSPQGCEINADAAQHGY